MAAAGWGGVWQWWPAGAAQGRGAAVRAASWWCSSGEWSGKTLAAAPGCAERCRPRQPPVYDHDVGKGEL